MNFEFYMKLVSVALYKECMKTKKNLRLFSHSWKKKLISLKTIMFDAGRQAGND
jgi:hypothetical protein